MISILTHGIGAPDIGLAAARIATGTFFALSGFNKLFNKGRHQTITQTLKDDRVPFVPVMQWWVPGWEFIGGAMLTIGFLSVFSAGVLAIICLVACICEAKARVASYKPINAADKADDYLYLPEVIYIALLAVTIFAGAGKYSIDYFL